MIIPFGIIVSINVLTEHKTIFNRTTTNLFRIDGYVIGIYFYVRSTRYGIFKSIGFITGKTGIIKFSIIVRILKFTRHTLSCSLHIFIKKQRIGSLFMFPMARFTGS